MGKELVRVGVTGGGGQIAYSLLFRIASGELLGPNQKISLSIRDVEENRPLLQALAMELEDCAFPLLEEIRVGSDPFELFEGLDLVFLVGALPRGPGMERGDLLMKNAEIFVLEGRALDQVASPSAQVLVVGNPCNTNCLIAMSQAKRIPRKNFHAMMRLDHNRSLALLAKKAKVPVDRVEKLIVWGNHSSTQVPDYTHARIEGKRVDEVISDRHFLQVEFFETVQRRGAAIIAARGKSSAGSAAHAALEAMRSIVGKSQKGDWMSSAVSTDGNPYGIEENLVFGFPCHFKGEGKYEIVPNLEWDYFIREKIAITQKELIEERECVRRYLEGKIDV